MTIFNSNYFIFCFIISYHLILYRIAEGALPEKECTEQGGKCQEKSSCSGQTRDGLCPRQSASIKCCFTTPSVPSEGPFPEKECTEQGGKCQEKSSCSGHTRDGLCPRQSASIKCCFTPSGNGNLIPNGCGCSYNYATGPTDGPAPGAKRLAAYFTGRFGGRTEIYNPIKIPGSNTWSLHAEGRAVDLFLTGTRGREAFDHAVEIACSTGIQEVIFSRRIWTAGKGEHNYNGQNPHTDHVHIGLNRCGAQKFNF